MNLYHLLRPALFTLPAETAHGTGMTALRAAQGTPLEAAARSRLRVDDPRLRTTAFGQSCPNPVGVAAGFDKNAEIPRMLAALGFGHVEVGGVTAERQPGNPSRLIIARSARRRNIRGLGLPGCRSAVTPPTST